MAIEHRGTKEMWADGNAKPLQGTGFRLFRSKVMGIPEDYDDEAERIKTHPPLLPKPKEDWVVSSADLQVLSKTLGVEGQDHDRQGGSTPPVTPAPLGRRSVLDNDKFGAGNRPYWEMKEGRVSSRCPDLLRTLSKVQDSGQRRLMFESHRRKMGGITGNPARQLEPWEIRLSRQ